MIELHRSLTEVMFTKEWAKSFNSNKNCIVTVILAIALAQTPVFADYTPTIEIDIHAGSNDPNQHLTFYPPSTSASVGQTIMFGNGDTVPHEIVSGTPSSGPDGRFDSGMLNPGQYFSYTLTEYDIGTLNFYDKTYPWMTGTITVQQSSNGYKVIHNVGADAGDGKTIFDVQYQSVKNITSSSVNLQDRSVSFVLAGQTTQSSNLVLDLPTGLITPPFFGVQLDGQLTKSFTETVQQGMTVLTIPITPVTEQVSIIGTSVLQEPSSQQAIPQSTSPIPITSQQQIKPTSGGIIDVGFSTTPANPTPGNQANLHVSFISKSTDTIQQHIDYKISVMQGSSQICGTDGILHSTNGSINLPCQFPSAATYQIIAEVDGILFQPIPPQTATFSFSVGGMQNSAQAAPTIAASTDKTSYNYGDTVTVSGNIQNAIAGTYLSSVITGPNNEIVYKGGISVNLDGSFMNQIQIAGYLWNTTGVYHDSLQYGSTSNTQLSFTVNYNIPNAEQPSSAVVDMTKQIISTTPENFGSDNASTINLKCQAFLTYKLWVDAYNYCAQALQLDPQNTDLQNNETYAYNTITQAVSHIIQADNSLNNTPNDQVALATKAADLMALGKYNDSLVYDNQILETDPKNTEVLANKVTALLYLGRYDDALQATNSTTLDVTNYPLKIATLYNLERYNETLLYVDEYYKQLNEQDQYSECLDNLEKALVYEKMGMQTTANDYYQFGNSCGGISADNSDIVKARMYYDLLMDFNKTSEYAEKIPSDSPYYRQASYLKVIAYYYQSKSENQLSTEVGILGIQPVFTTNMTVPVSSNQTMQIPKWIKNNAKWWSEGAVNDNDFVQGVQYLVKQKVIHIPPQTQTASSATQIPAWVKSTAGWWGNGQVSDDDFVKGIEYLVRIGIIKV